MQKPAEELEKVLFKEGEMNLKELTYFYKILLRDKNILTDISNTNNKVIYGLTEGALQFTPVYGIIRQFFTREKDLREYKKVFHKKIQNCIMKKYTLLNSSS